MRHRMPRDIRNHRIYQSGAKIHRMRAIQQNFTIRNQFTESLSCTEYIISRNTRPGGGNITNFNLGTFSENQRRLFPSKMFSNLSEKVSCTGYCFASLVMMLLSAKNLYFKGIHLETTAESGSI
jgi:hypothetical protein